MYKITFERLSGQIYLAFLEFSRSLPLMRFNNSLLACRLITLAILTFLPLLQSLTVLIPKATFSVHTPLITKLQIASTTSTDTLEKKHHCESQ